MVNPPLLSLLLGCWVHFQGYADQQDAKDGGSPVPSCFIPPKAAETCVMICGVEMPLDAQLSDATSHLSSNALHLFFFHGQHLYKSQLESIFCIYI